MRVIAHGRNFVKRSLTHIDAAFYMSHKYNDFIKTQAKSHTCSYIYNLLTVSLAREFVVFYFDHSSATISISLF